MLYRTYFNLTNPVKDYEEARQYLIEDDMTKYMAGDSRIPYATFLKIKSIIWVLKDVDRGQIDLITTELLSDSELAGISEWVSGQNSDGLGEGFEQQDFACYEDRDSYDEDYYDEYADDFVMCSFDWKTNDYIFELISDEV